MLLVVIALATVLLAGFARSAPTVQYHELTVELSQSDPVNSLCTVEDKFYQDYVVGLGKVVDDILKDFQEHQEEDNLNFYHLQTKPPATVVDLNETIDGPLNQLYTAICNLEHYIPWLKQSNMTSDQPGVAERVSFLQRLANVSVIGLRSQLVRFINDECYQSITTPPQTPTTTTPRTSTGALDDTSPGQTLQQTGDLSQPCLVSEIQILQSELELDGEPDRPTAILHGMLEAVARLDGVIKKYFS